MANVNFVRTTKQKQINRETYDANALYFTKDSHEMYWAEKLLTDGFRYVQSFDKLPSFDTAADGKIYFVLSTGKGYVINTERNAWHLVIYAATNNIDQVAEIELHETVLTVSAARALENQLKKYVQDQVVVAGDKEIYTVDRFEDLPEVGNSALTYRVIDEAALYQWDEFLQEYEKISGASDDIKIQIIYGGNANGSTN